MKNAILLHGTCSREEYFSDEYPSLSNSHWFPWLQKQLLINNIFTQTPEIPDAHSPIYSKWKREFEKFGVDENTILVGHSCGGGFLTRWLTENKVSLHKLILVAPWLDPERENTTSFFDFEIDTDITKRAKETHIFVSSDDDKDVLDSVEIIKNKLPDAKLHEFTNKGHFCYGDLKSEKFPELLEVILK